MAKRTRPEVVQGVIAGLLVLVGVAMLFAVARPAWTWYHLLGAWLVVVNVVVFFYYGYDKMRARVGGWRIAEVVLHGLAFAGGTLGAYLGMRAFRHKTIKASFRVVFWVIAVLQGMLIAAVVYRLWTHHGA